MAGVGLGAHGTRAEAGACGLESAGPARGGGCAAAAWGARRAGSPAGRQHARRARRQQRRGPRGARPAAGRAGHPRHTARPPRGRTEHAPAQPWRGAGAARPPRRWPQHAGHPGWARAGRVAGVGWPAVTSPGPSWPPSELARVGVRRRRRGPAGRGARSRPGRQRPSISVALGPGRWRCGPGCPRRRPRSGTEGARGAQPGQPRSGRARAGAGLAEGLLARAWPCPAVAALGRAGPRASEEASLPSRGRGPRARAAACSGAASRRAALAASGLTERRSLPASRSGPAQGLRQRQQLRGSRERTQRQEGALSGRQTPRRGRVDPDRPGGWPRA